MDNERKNGHDKTSIESANARIKQLESAIEAIEHLASAVNTWTPSKRLSGIANHAREVME